MLNKKTGVILITIIFLLLFGFFTSSYDYNPWVLFIVYLLYFVFTIILYKKQLNYKLPTFIIITLTLITLIIKTIKVGSLNFDLPTFSFLSSIILFYLFFKGFLKNKIAFSILFLISNYILCFYIYHFSTNYKTFGTYDGEYNYVFKKTITVKNYKENTKNILDDKIYVIDFWNKGCGVCFKKFPLFESLKDKYSRNSKIEFLAVNIYTHPEDIEYSQKLFKKMRLNFDTYYIEKQQASELDISAFPTVIVIKNNKIIFKGSIETLNALNFLYLK